MNWWQIILVAIGSIVGGIATLIVGVMIYFGWRISNRGPL